MEEIKRKAVYNPDADKKYLENNEEAKKRKNRNSKKSACKSFIKNDATAEELKELIKLIKEILKK